MKAAASFIFALAATVAPAAEKADGFLSALTKEQREQMGLDLLSPGQLAALEVAVESYRGRREAEAAKVAADAAVAEFRKTEVPLVEKKAADAAVDDYKKSKEPSVVARALDALRRKHQEEQQERITAKILGRFDGWDGQTLFRLDNGQIWRQAAPDSYDHKPAEDVAVVVYRSSSGYWRLRVLDDKGAWVTVKRVN